MLLGACLAGFSAAAAALDDAYDQTQNDYDPSLVTPWQEQSFKLPPYPGDGDLTEVASQPPTTALTMLVDLDQVTVGEEDRVVRYVLVLRSRSGVQNVFYEGMRCPAREFRTYAYGMQGKWRQRDTDWTPIDQGVMGRYRDFLHDRLLCEPGGRYLPVEEIRQRLRYGRSDVEFDR